MYDSVLIPTDGSPGAEAAIGHGVNIAEKYGATVHALYIIDAGDPSGSSTEQLENLETELQEQGEESAETVTAQAALEGVDAVREISSGAPRKAILAYADDADIDLIVMGSHGKTGLSRVLLGSVAEHVVRHSSSPVLIVKPDEDDVHE